MSSLWIICSMQDTPSKWLWMSSGAHTVICEVSQRDWEEFQMSCEELLAAAHQLWSASESLVIEAAEVETDGGSEWLADCQRLLAACDHPDNYSKYAFLYEVCANVLENYKYGDEFVGISYSSKYSKYSEGLPKDMLQFYIHHGLPCVWHQWFLLRVSTIVPSIH